MSGRRMNNEALIQTVEELFRASDVRVHAVLHKIVALALESGEETPQQGLNGQPKE